jgi:hypothetical protein
MKKIQIKKKGPLWLSPFITIGSFDYDCTHLQVQYYFDYLNFFIELAILKPKLLVSICNQIVFFVTCVVTIYLTSMLDKNTIGCHLLC